MDIRKQVIDIVIAWSKTTVPISTEPLLNIWFRGPRSSTLPFKAPNGDPAKSQGVVDLIDRLQKVFRESFGPGNPLDSWKPSIFAPPTGINTVDDLVEEVENASFDAQPFLAEIAPGEESVTAPTARAAERPEVTAEPAKNLETAKASSTGKRTQVEQGTAKKTPTDKGAKGRKK